MMLRVQVKGAPTRILDASRYRRARLSQLLSLGPYWQCARRLVTGAIAGGFWWRRVGPTGQGSRAVTPWLALILTFVAVGILIARRSCLRASEANEPGGSRRSLGRRPPNGSTQAFARLVERHQAGAARFCAAPVAMALGRDDLAQEKFLFRPGRGSGAMKTRTSRARLALPGPATTSPINAMRSGARNRVREARSRPNGPPRVGPRSGGPYGAGGGPEPTLPGDKRAVWRFAFDCGLQSRRTCGKRWGLRWTVKT